MLAWLRRIPRSAAALGLVAFLCYLPASWWGAPTATHPETKKVWGTDDETPMGPLAEVHHIIAPKPAKDRNLGYPLMYSFLAASAYAPYLGFLKVTGGWEKVSGEYPWGFEDPVGTLKTLTVISHLVTVLLGVMCVLCVWASARWLWSERAGLLAGVFMLSCYPFYYYFRTGNVDGPMVAFLGLATLGYARMLAKGVDVKGAVIFGVGAGFAMATKESCYSVLGLMIVALVVRHVVKRPAGQSLASWAFWKPVAAAAATGILCFGFGSGLFIQPSRYLAHIEFHRQLAADVAAGKDHMAVFFDASLAGRIGLAKAIIGHVAAMVSPAGLALAAIGVAWTAARRDWTGVLVALPAVAYLLAMPLHLPLSQLRYVLPAAPGLALAVGGAMHHAFAGPKAARWLLGALYVLGAGTGFLRGLDITHAMLNDSRYAAGHWLAEQLRPGDRIDYFGGSERLPPLPPGVEIARAAKHMSAHKKAPKGPEIQAEIRRRWHDDPPRFVITLPDHSSRGMEHHHTCPPQTFADLNSGKLGYELAAEFKTPALLPWVRRPRLDYPMVNPPIRIFAPGPGIVGTSTTAR